MYLKHVYNSVKRAIVASVSGTALASLNTRVVAEFCSGLLRLLSEQKSISASMMDLSLYDC